MKLGNEETLQRIKGGLIVSCQALPEEPLHSSFIMGRMHWRLLRQEPWESGLILLRILRKSATMVDLPIIGIIKKVYDDCPDVYITPTIAEVDALTACGVEIIATDATRRDRPGGETIETFFSKVRAKFPDQLFMADCSNVEEGMEAAALGFDLIGTTMASYTPYTRGCPLPPFDMIEYLVKNCGKPVVAEGNIITPEHLRHAMDLGVLTAVVGSAITRPLEITKRFVAVLK